MAEVLGLGLTHYPPLLGIDEDMSWVLRWTLDDPDIPADRKDPANWTEEMRAEWSDDQGLEAAAGHRIQLMEGFSRVRDRLERFAPDVVIMFGDDQYENFKEDLIPPFSVLAYDDLDVQPWRSMKRRVGTNHWGEPDDVYFKIPGAPDVGRHLVTQLIERDFDVAYAYKPLHQEGLSHSFLNALLLLDHDRNGWPYPVLPVPLNCYGSKVISNRGSVSRFADDQPRDPPSPTPRRCMQLGAAIMDICRESPWRVALVASSSWSHAFLTDRTWRLFPDHEADRRLYDALVTGSFDYWRSRTTADLEAAGQQEVLNWFCLAGAMERGGARPDYTSMVSTWIFNSNKVFATFGDVDAQPDTTMSAPS